MIDPPDAPPTPPSGPEAPPRTTQPRAPLLIAAGLLFLAALAVAYTLGARSTPGSLTDPLIPRGGARTAAPAFVLRSLRGPETIALAEFRGQVIVLNFFASWCGPCALEANDLQRTYEEVREQGVVFFGVAIQDEYASAKAFLDRHGVTYPAAFDADGTVMQLYRVTGIPTTLIIDPEGRITVRHAGIFVGDEGRARLRALIAQAREDGR